MKGHSLLGALHPTGMSVFPLGLICHWTPSHHLCGGEAPSQSALLPVEKGFNTERLSVSTAIRNRKHPTGSVTRQLNLCPRRSHVTPTPALHSGKPVRGLSAACLVALASSRGSSSADRALGTAPLWSILSAAPVSLHQSPHRPASSTCAHTGRSALTGARALWTVASGGGHGASGVLVRKAA